ncbi:MAG: FtsQ-type POTRA domain-containing protein [Candidatus Cloacimonadia bacterium]|jgi:cell division septal protein FtsQ
MKKNRELKKRVKRRGNSRYVMLFIMIGVGLIILSSILYTYSKKWSFFNVRKIEISGNQNLETDFLREMVSEYIGVNINTISARQLSYKYSNIVRVKKMKLRKVLPFKLKLIFIERIGYAYIKTIEGVIVPIDKEFVILDKGGFYLQENLPIIETKLSIADLQTGETLEDENVTQLIEVHKLIEENNIDGTLISEYYINRGNVYLIEANTGSVVCLGNKDFPTRIQKLKFVCDNVGIVEYKHIDLKFENRIIVKSGGEI